MLAGSFERKRIFQVGQEDLTGLTLRQLVHARPVSS